MRIRWLFHPSLNCVIPSLVPRPSQLIHKDKRYIKAGDKAGDEAMLYQQEISFDPTNEQHLYALHYVFTARINAGITCGIKSPLPDAGTT